MVKAVTSSPLLRMTVVSKIDPEREVFHDAAP
jgi:hypothetical protein